MGQSDEYAEVDGLFLDGLSEADRGRRVKADRMGKFDLVFHAGGGGGGRFEEGGLAHGEECVLLGDVVGV